MLWTPIPINQPGVGSNAFAHESGIHADGALKDRRNYELYDPEDVGRGEPELLQTGRIIIRENTVALRASDTSMTTWNTLSRRQRSKKDTGTRSVCKPAHTKAFDGR